MNLAHILVVDDDSKLRKLLAKYLGQQTDWLVTMAEDADDARQKMAMFTFDLIVLDGLMPKETGVELARSLRGQNAPPILMLTAMGEAEERIAGLEAGVEDYLTKPFEPRELVLRIQNILRRTTSATPADGKVVFGAFCFFPAEGRLLEGEEPVHLTTAEATLLTRLARKPNIPLSRADLADDADSERSIDVLMTRLRKKLEPEPAKPIYLQTVRGTGYILRVNI
jgi:two-component system, OmpR family, phosphate regulon response regulator OmpR